MAACLAREGHELIGVDINTAKVDLINAGRSPIVEPLIDELITEAVELGHLRASLDVAEAVHSTELSAICVGTPAKPDGRQELDSLVQVCQDIGQVLGGKKEDHLVVIRSTTFPGTVENVAIPVLEACAHKRAGTSFNVVANPEFLREGTSVYDFYHPPMIVVGEFRQGSSAAVEEMYRPIEAPLIKTTVRTAEMIKYACNAFHALKVVFANEIGNLCQAIGVDARDLMALFVRDTKLNIAPAYLRPGFAFGGSCLPKDLQALLHEAREMGVFTPVLEAILPSNQAQIEKGISLIMSTGKRKVAILGLGFKSGTDDLRGSPMVAVVRALLDGGLTVRIYDRAVDPSLLVGANREFMEEQLPALPSLLDVSLEEVLSQAEVIVINQELEEEVLELSGLLRDDHVVVDFIGQEEIRNLLRGTYIGVCW